jgi:hypothetical protein
VAGQSPQKGDPDSGSSQDTGHAVDRDFEHVSQRSAGIKNVMASYNVLRKLVTVEDPHDPKRKGKKFLCAERVLMYAGAKALRRYFSKKLDMMPQSILFLS